ASPPSLTDFTTVTETWGLPASPEQLAMQYTRYRMAAELVRDGAVLEVGCGTGMGLPYLKAHARMVVGGDYTMDLLRQARKQVPDANLVRMDAQHLPFRDGAFDAVVLLEMIYYLEQHHGVKRAVAKGKVLGVHPHEVGLRHLLA